MPSFLAYKSSACPLPVAGPGSKQPKILIFDKATGALDEETAESFAKTINRWKGQVTMLLSYPRYAQQAVVDQAIHLLQVLSYKYVLLFLAKYLRFIWLSPLKELHYR